MIQKDNNKIVGEKETRSKLLALAKNLGCEIDVKKLFNKYDKLLKQCKNKEEYKQIAILGSAELHKFLNCSGALVVNNKEIIPADKNSEIES